MQDSNISTGTILFLVVVFVFRTQGRFLIIAITLPPINKSLTDEEAPPHARSQLLEYSFV